MAGKTFGTAQAYVGSSGSPRVQRRASFSDDRVRIRGLRRPTYVPYHSYISLNFRFLSSSCVNVETVLIISSRVSTLLRGKGWSARLDPACGLALYPHVDQPVSHPLRGHWHIFVQPSSYAITSTDTSVGSTFNASHNFSVPTGPIRSSSSVRSLI